MISVPLLAGKEQLQSNDTKQAYSLHELFLKTPDLALALYIQALPTSADNFQIYYTYYCCLASSRAMILH